MTVVDPILASEPTTFTLTRKGHVFRSFTLAMTPTHKPCESGFAIVPALVRTNERGRSSCEVG